MERSSINSSPVRKLARNSTGYIEEFLQFGLTYANDSIVDARFAPAKTTERRFISLTELSKRTGLDRRTLESWNRKGILPLQRVGSGSSTRYIADAREIRLPHNLQKSDGSSSWKGAHEFLQAVEY